MREEGGGGERDGGERLGKGDTSTNLLLLWDTSLSHLKVSLAALVVEL